MEDLKVQKRELFSAIARDDIPQVRRLSATNVSPYHYNAQGQTALEMALQRGNPEIIRLLQTAAVANSRPRRLFVSSDVVSCAQTEPPINVLAPEVFSGQSLKFTQPKSYSTLLIEFGRSQLRRLSTNYNTLINAIIPSSQSNTLQPKPTVTDSSVSPVERLVKNNKDATQTSFESLQPQPRKAVNRKKRSKGLAPQVSQTAAPKPPTLPVHHTKTKAKHLRVLSSTTELTSGQQDGQSNDLLSAVLANDLETVYTLLEAKADPRPANWYDKPVLVTAAENGFFEIVKLLVAAGAKVNGGYERLPLHCAAGNGDLDMVQFLLAHGAYLDAKEVGDRTAIMVAAAAGRLSVVEALVNRGANLSAVNTEKETALMLAAKENHQRVYDYLLPRSPQLVSRRPAAYASNTRGVNSSPSPFSKTLNITTQAMAEDPIEQAQRILDSGFRDCVETSMSNPATKTARQSDFNKGFQEIIQAMDRSIENIDDSVA